MNTRIALLILLSLLFPVSVQPIDLSTVIDRVSQDSIQSYVEHLQAYNGRAAGTYGAFASCYWMVNKLKAFGYDSVVADTFTEYVSGTMIKFRNVVAYKPGTTYPYRQIVIGGHYDALDDSPGADDNGSGTVAVLEMARALAGVDTKMTIVFVLFDGEEVGLVGSNHYAGEAVEAGDRIVFMLNMDMIGDFLNTAAAEISSGDNDTYAQMWIELADSIPSIGITGSYHGGVVISDEGAFLRRGYDVVGVHEDKCCYVYHSARDSVVYLNLDYLTRMAKGSLAAVVAADASVVPPPGLILISSEGLPEIVTPNLPTPFRVHVVEEAGGGLVPGSVYLNYTLNGGEPFSLPMTPVDGDVYGIDLPCPECGTRLEYYVSAEEAGGNVFFRPDPATPAVAIVATGITVTFEDNFNADKGWEVSGDALRGHWEICEANLYPPVGTDYDASRFFCVTGCDLMTDVDNGSAILKSPPIDVLNGITRIQFAFWYSNDMSLAPHEDVFTMGFYNGPAFVPVETVGPVEGASGEGWQVRDWWLSDYCNPVNPLRLCFNASDTGQDSRVEAILDAVKVTKYSFGPRIVPATVPNLTMGVPYAQQLEAAGCSSVLNWTDRYGYLVGTGLTLSVDGLLSGTPTDTGHIWFSAVVQDFAGLTDERAYSFRVRPDFTCGDANGDKMVNVADAVFLISYVFKGGPEPIPKNAGDANDDSWVNVGDAVYLINYVFHGGPPPAAGC